MSSEPPSSGLEDLEPGELADTGPSRVPLGAAGTAFGVCLVAAALVAALAGGPAGAWTYVAAFLVAAAVAAGLAARGAAYNRSQA